MSSAPKRNFTAKTARPTIDTSALYGMEEVATSAAASPAADVAKATPVAPKEDAGQQWVQFSTYLRRDTYLRLKQAEYWEPGFVVRHQIEQAVNALLDQLEGANRSLPDDQLQKLLQKNKKLQS